MDVYLCDFQHIRPRFEVDQTYILEWIAWLHAEAQSLVSDWKDASEEKQTFQREILQRLIKIGTGHEKAKKRGIHITDIFQYSKDSLSIYNLTKDPRGLSLHERTLFFARMTEEILDQFYFHEKNFPGHLIHVTCTGYTSPSAAQKLIAKREKGNATVVTHAYHMGCYASFPAIRMGSGFLSTYKEKVDVVHTELCSIHMNPLSHEMDQLVIQSLFGDGFIKYSLLSKEKMIHGQHAFQLLALHEEILPNSDKFMTWHTSDWGMQMGLTKEVPSIITKHIASYLDKLLTKTQHKNIPPLFAIHPGGPKIISQVAKNLQLSPSQIAHSQAVFNGMGNMSSATLPHIWDRMLHDPDVPLGQPVISIAFGPGLSISGAIFEKRAIS